MAEIKPIVVTPTVAQEVIVTALRYLGTVITGVTAVFALASRGDIKALIEYFQGETGTGLIAALFAIGLGAYGAYRAYRNKSKLIVTADAAPNRIAVVATKAEAKEMELGQ